MQRPGYNPTRRNRNIGTQKAGHGQNNRLVISAAWADDRIFYEKLVNPVEIPVSVGSVSLHLLVEPTLSGFAHACSVDDLVHVLQMLPVAHFDAIKLIVLRQPKRKEQILSPCWGRLVYWSDIGRHSGPAIFLEAQDIGRPVKWSTSLSPDLALELDRLRQDGHSIVSDKRHHVIHSTLDSVRRTQLYRTLPHEVGHYVDYLQSVEQPSGDDYDKWFSLNQRYHNKASQEKESFAHRYADDFRDRKTADGQLPFDRILDDDKMKRFRMNPEWFVASNGG